jgi:hypothetical protein
MPQPHLFATNPAARRIYLTVSPATQAHHAGLFLEGRPPQETALATAATPTRQRRGPTPAFDLTTLGALFLSNFADSRRGGLLTGTEPTKRDPAYHVCLRRQRPDQQPRPSPSVIRIDVASCFWSERRGHHAPGFFAAVRRSCLQTLEDRGPRRLLGLILGLVRRVSREACGCCIGVQLNGLMQIVQLSCHVRHLRRDMQEAPSKNLARVVF